MSDDMNRCRLGCEAASEAERSSFIPEAPWGVWGARRDWPRLARLAAMARGGGNKGKAKRGKRKPEQRHPLMEGGA